MQLVTFMPGNSTASHPHQRRVAEYLRDAGLLKHVRAGLQINSFLNGPNGFPGAVPPEKVGAATAYHTCLRRDWLHEPPAFAYWDYEPKYTDSTGRTFNWRLDGHRNGYDDLDFALVHAAAAEIHAAAKGLPLALYGMPLLFQSPVRFFDLPRYARDDIRRLMEPFDWVWAGFYATDRQIEAEFSPIEQRERILTGLGAVRLLGKPVIAATRFRRWRYPGDEEEFARVTFETFAEAGVETVAIWDNPKDDQHATNVIRGLDTAMPVLKSFVGTAARPTISRQEVPS